MTTLETVLASAAIGALVSTGGTLVGQWLERRSRRAELALSTSVQLAIKWTEIGMEAGRPGYTGPPLGDPGVFFATYFRWVKHVMEKGKLPPDVKDPGV